MATAKRVPIGQFVHAAKAHRRLFLSVTAALLVYTLLGFFLAPWLLKKNAIESVASSWMIQPVHHLPVPTRSLSIFNSAP